MYEKKQTIIKSPDLSKLREVIIDYRTRIYISPDSDVEEARNKYLMRNNSKRVK